ncbi:MAG: hypothetical protein QXN29_05090 [Thermofilaceae archaeon]
MKSWTKTIKTIVRLYKWRILVFILALVTLIIMRGYVNTVQATQLPPGSGPVPEIDPL